MAERARERALNEAKKRILVMLNLQKGKVPLAAALGCMRIDMIHLDDGGSTVRAVKHILLVMEYEDETIISTGTDTEEFPVLYGINPQSRAEELQLATNC